MLLKNGLLLLYCYTDVKITDAQTVHSCRTDNMFNIHTVQTCNYNKRNLTGFVINLY